MTYYNWRGEAMPETEAEQGRISGTSAGNETINAPNAPGSSLSGEGGGDLLVGNSHGNRFWITDTKDRVQEPTGGGVDTMIGWTSLKAAPNIENLQVNGAFNYAYGNELSNLIVVDDQTHWIYGGKGDDVMVGAATAKTSFIVRAGEGNDVIYNWQGNDQLQLWGYGFTSAADIKAAMSQVGSDVVLKLSASETLTFRDETLASFSDRQFLLPLDTSKLGGLTFADEFNSLSIWDPNTGEGTWNARFPGNLKDPWAYTITSNGERQVYIQPDFYGQGEQAAGVQPLTISNGVLSITASRIPDAQRDAAWGREYYSGMINTLGTFEQQYGYFEMRADLPDAVGTWPAFWLMPTPYVAQTEADIMEGLAATPLVDYRRAWGGGENLYDNALKIDSTGFHTYGMLWTPETVTFYYDGVAVLQAATPANWTHPMGMIVNMAVGGWGGEPNSLQFPDTLNIDYIRVYNLADNSAVIERGTPELPVATLKPDGGQTSGTAQQTLYFDQDGQALSGAKIAVYDAKPTTLPPGKTFVIWEDSGAVFGAVSDGATLGKATGLMAGDSRVFTGSGTWLTDGKVALGYMAPAVTGQSAWVMIFDPSTNTFTKHQLGNSTGDIDFVALKNGNFAASWDAPDGTTHARAYDGWAYDGKGWFGPERVISGDLKGFAANGDLIATSGSGEQLYSINNPPPGVDAIVSIGPMAGVSKAEGDSGQTAFTFTITRDYDLSEKTTVAWTVRGQGGSPADALDFVGGAFPSGVATFEINQASTTITVLVQGDTYTEGNEEFLVTLVNPVGAKLGQATATGFIQSDGDTGGAPPPPPSGGGSTTVGFSAGTVTLAEGNSGSTAFTFTVTRAGSTTGTSTVNWQVSGSGGDAANGADFAGGALPSGALTFAAGETSKTITVSVAGDTTAEANESFTITLSGATGATLGAATAGGVITNDDSTPPPPSGGSGQVINSPGPGSTLTGTSGADTLNASQGGDVLTGGAGADKFAWAKEPWSPATVTDFVVGTDKLDLSALLSGYSGSDPVRDKYVWLMDDGSGGTNILFDKDGAAAGQQWPNYIIKLQGVSAGGLTWAQLTGAGGTTPPASPQIGFATTNAVEHGEGNSGSTPYSFTVVRTGSTEGSSTVNWTVSGASSNPASASDFTGNAFPSGSLTFAAGETSKVITVNVSGDTLNEATEGFNVTLSGASGATLGTATAFGVIGNDDTPPPKPGPPQLYLDNAPVSHAEGNSGGTTFSYAVTRSGSTEGSSTVNWSVAGSGSNPANGADFQGGALPSGTLTFAAGEISKTITFTVAGDTTVEADETFTVSLSGASGAGIGSGTSTGTIVNDDTSSPPPSGGGQVINSPGPGSTLTGTSGADTLNASQGADVLTGGAGADKFAWAKEPWSPATVTDFVVGTDKLDLSALLSGYSGSDPVRDKYIWLTDDGNGGTNILFDKDGAATGQQWPNYIIRLEHVPSAGLTWAQLTGGGGTPPPASPQIALTTTSLTRTEGEAFAYTVTRTGSTASSSTVNWSVSGSGSSPAASGDFQGATSGTLTFAAGETTKTITISSLNDTTVEPDEGFTLTLSGATNATLGTATATGVIANNDTATPPPPPSGDAVMVVFAGQSNMGAYNTGPENVSAAWHADPKTLIWNEVTRAWETLQPGVNTGYPGDTDSWGPEVQFAIDFRASHPDTVLRIVKEAEGGSSLARNDASGAYDWSPSTNGELFDRVASMISDASAAAGGLKPSAVFFGQGETDADSAAMAAAYRTNLTDFLAAVRAEWMGDADGKIGYFLIGSSPPYAGEVRDAQGDVDVADADAVSFDTVGFAMQSDGLHYAPAGVDRIGANFFDLYESWTSGSPPPPPTTEGQVITSPGAGAHLTGGAGADTLISSQGPDQLTGGAGADHFVFTKENWSPAEITDFQHGVDKIDLRQLFDAVGYSGTDPFADGRIILIDDGEGGTKVIIDKDGPGPNPQWGNYVFHIDGVAPTTLTSSDWIIQ